MFGLKRGAQQQTMNSTQRLLHGKQVAAYLTLRAKLSDSEPRDAAEYQRAKEAVTEVAQTIVKAVDAEFEEFANGMIAEFIKRAAGTLIQLDDPPTEVSQALISELTQFLDGSSEEIESAIRAKLSAWEQLSRDTGLYEGYEDVLKDRFKYLTTMVWLKALQTSSPMVLARKEELGLDVENSEHLELGRKLLQQARDPTITLSRDETVELARLMQVIERNG